jgi:ABC-2 type transport system permease protein
MMYFFQAIYTIWRREIIRYVRDRARIFSTFLQPLMFLAIFGLGLRSTLAQGNFGIDFIKFMYPGIIAMSVMGIAFFSTVSTVWDREFGFLKEILVAPVPRVAIVIGKISGAMTIASTQALILLVLAPFIGVSIHIVSILELFLFFLVLSFAISGLGLLIASLMKTTESFGVVMQVLIFPMFFLSGAFFPLTSIPGWLSVISRINPLTYGVDAARQILLGPQTPAAVLEKLSLYPIHIDILALAIFSLIVVSAAVWAFNRRD